MKVFKLRYNECFLPKDLTIIDILTAGCESLARTRADMLDAAALMNLRETFRDNDEPKFELDDVVFINTQGNTYVGPVTVVHYDRSCLEYTLSNGESWFVSHLLGAGEMSALLSKESNK